jgi:hypothetical protein
MLMLSMPQNGCRFCTIWAVKVHVLETFLSLYCTIWTEKTMRSGGTDIGLETRWGYSRGPRSSSPRVKRLKNLDLKFRFLKTGIGTTVCTWSEVEYGTMAFF